jgi:hypothetical protein
MLLSLIGVLGRADAAEPIPNPKIDADGFLRITHEAMTARATRRLTEAQFLAMAAEPGTIILDARSADRYALLHVRGAISLPFTDMTIESMRRVLPNPKVKILIYCNNNFEHDEIAFATKAAPAALNLSTFVSLYTYGYKNVYELGPMLDVNRTKIPLVRR